MCTFFFFQAEDGIRDRNVTGVQTCALPILLLSKTPYDDYRKRIQAGTACAVVFKAFELTGITLYVHVKTRAYGKRGDGAELEIVCDNEIGRASCRERVEDAGGAGAVEKRDR